MEKSNPLSKEARHSIELYAHLHQFYTAQAIKSYDLIVGILRSAKAGQVISLDQDYTKSPDPEYWLPASVQESPVNNERFAFAVIGFIFTP